MAQLNAQYHIKLNAMKSVNNRYRNLIDDRRNW